MDLEIYMWSFVVRDKVTKQLKNTSTDSIYSSTICFRKLYEKFSDLFSHIDFVRWSKWLKNVDGVVIVAKKNWKSQLNIYIYINRWNQCSTDWIYN